LTENLVIIWNNSEDVLLQQGRLFNFLFLLNCLYMRKPTFSTDYGTLGLLIASIPR